MDLKRICLYMILPPLLVSCGLSGAIAGEGGGCGGKGNFY